MNDSPYMSLLVAYYDDEREAQKILDELRGLDRPGAFRIVELAVITLCDEGKLQITQAADRRGKKRIAGGAVVGGIIGAIFPPSILAMTALGTVAAAAWNHFRDQGFERNLLREVGENVPPGGAAVAAVVEDEWIRQVESAMEGYALLQRYIFNTDSFAGVKMFERE
jgi:uncharacterized membrane protein